MIMASFEREGIVSRKGTGGTITIGRGLLIDAIIFFMQKGIIAIVHGNTELTLKHIQDGLKPGDHCSLYCSKKKKACHLRTVPKIVLIAHKPASTLHAIIRLVKNIESNLYHGKRY